MIRRLAVTVLLAALALPATAGAQSQRAVADPDGGPRWSAQLLRSGSPACVSVRRGGDRFGRVCERLSRRRVFAYSALTERRPDPRASRTVFVAWFHRSVLRARLRTPDGVVRYRRGRGARLLVAVLAGVVERPPLRVVVRRAGRTRVLRGAPTAGVQVGDPQGGPAWRTATATGEDDEVCVRWQRVPPRFGAPPDPAEGPPRCGETGGPVPVASAETADGRLVVVGVASASVRGLTLQGEGAPRTLAIERRTRAFIAVLPGGTDPAALRLVARLADGREVERALDLAG